MATREYTKLLNLSQKIRWMRSAYVGMLSSSLQAMPLCARK